MIRKILIVVALSGCAIADDECMMSAECRQAVTDYNLGVGGAIGSAYAAAYPYPYAQPTTTVYQPGVTGCRQYLPNGQIVYC